MNTPTAPCAKGLKDGKITEVRACVAHANGYVLTAVRVAAALLQYLDGSVRKPGLWMMGHLADPTCLMRDMENMGITISMVEFAGY